MIEMMQTYYLYNYYLLDESMTPEEKFSTINIKILTIVSFAGRPVLLKEIIMDYLKYLEHKDVIEDFYASHQQERNRICLKKTLNQSKVHI